MHKSRLFAITMDCQDLKKGADFWSRALGVAALPRTEGSPYLGLESPAPGVRIWLQEVPEGKTSKTRAHLDLETDDVDAEVERLEALGARRQQQVDTWWIMEDPCGNEFCVLPIFSSDFPEGARTWDRVHAS